MKKLIASVTFTMFTIFSSSVRADYASATTHSASDNMWPDAWTSLCFSRPDGGTGTEMDCYATIPSSSDTAWRCVWGHLDVVGYTPDARYPDWCDAADPTSDTFYREASRVTVTYTGTHEEYVNCYGEGSYPQCSSTYPTGTDTWITVIVWFNPEAGWGSSYYACRTDEDTGQGLCAMM